MKYYHLNPAREDRHGSVPSINSVDVDLDFSPRLVPEGGLVVPIVDLMEGLVENDQFWEDPVPLRIPIKEEHNGPARFLDLLTVHNFARAALVVSQPFREVLDRFSLPPHAVYELETYFESKGKKDTRNYFIYHFVFDNMYEDLDFSGDSLSFEKVALSSSGRLKSREPYPGSFNSYEEYRKAHYDIQFSSGILDFWEIVPREFSYPYDYDLVINKGNVIINEDLKAVIDVAEFTGCTISEVEHMVITMEGAETGGHREKNRRIIGSLVSTDKTQTAAEKDYDALCKKRDRLLTAAAGVMAVMSKDGAEEQTDAEADIRRMEETLDVLFPKKLTEAIKSDSLPKKAIDGFTFLRPQNFFREVEFHVQNPETIKAVVIGENGLGDYLGLLLKKNSDYELAAKIWEFKHETGTVAPWKYWSL